MTGILTGLLGALGGPGNILKSIGSFVGDVLEGSAEGKVPFGQTLLRSGSKAVKQLIGQDKSINNAKQVIIPRDMLGRSRALPPQQNDELVLNQSSPAGFPSSRSLRVPKRDTILRDERRRPALDRDFRRVEEQIEDEIDSRRSERRRERRRRRDDSPPRRRSSRKRKDSPPRRKRSRRRRKRRTFRSAL